MSGDKRVVPHQQHVSEPPSHELIAEVDLEVNVLGGVHDGVDELQAGQLQHGVIGLPQRSQHRLKPVDTTHLSVHSHRF